MHLPLGMELVPLTPEREAQLDDDFQQEFNETVQAVLGGYADLRAGRVMHASEFLEALSAKHGLPGWIQA